MNSVRFFGFKPAIRLVSSAFAARTNRRREERDERADGGVMEAALRSVINGAAALALLVSLSASAAERSAFLGAWLISSSQPAPWARPGEPPVQSDISRLIGKRVAFAANRIDAPSPLACAGPHYEVKTYTPDL